MTDSDTCTVCKTMVPFANTKKPPSERESGRLSKWDIIRAGEKGWFFQKDGTTYCPKHVPAWVAEWRKRKKDKAEIDD